MLMREFQQIDTSVPMRPETPAVIQLADYTPPRHLVDSIDLTIDLAETSTRITARSGVRLNPDGQGRGDLILAGRRLELRSISINGQVLGADDFSVAEENLTIRAGALPDTGSFELVVETVIDPRGNTALEGLYLSNGTYCTQCEAQGFRKITYFPDRPDVLSIYTTRIIGDPQTAPILLSNGNKIDAGMLDDGRHWAEWHDPFPKPSYLFALVAGDLARVSDTFTTMSGRVVKLHIHVEHGMEDRTAYAMDALKRSMKWDEDVFGLEYDLDVFMIVAVSDFNMGAMENKGLNIFNAKYILAKPGTATDQDYTLIESIIAHEYFHNWTGNRVTCRDWFQLCLKEGLTVFRDQLFSADQRSAPVRRIEEVRMLRLRQFSEDAGPLAHPVRPDKYIEINNFYTATVYEKGAELCRMLHTILGPGGFRRGIDLYFKRHDGTAATVDDFVAAMADANDRNLDQFIIWYSQAGTPKITASGRHDPIARQYVLELMQVTAPTPNQERKAPLDIPVRIGLIGEDGRAMRTTCDGTTADTHLLALSGASARYVFENVDRRPIPSLLRGFSAPCHLEAGLADEDDLILMGSDTDPFNRWEAGQRQARKAMHLAARNAEFTLSTGFINAMSNTLNDDQLDPAYKALFLSLPTLSLLVQESAEADPEILYRARTHILTELAEALADQMHSEYQALNSNAPFDPGAGPAAQRSLRNSLLTYLNLLEEPPFGDLAARQYQSATNMTDTMAALNAVANGKHGKRDAIISDFYNRWKDDQLVIDKWFTAQALSTRLSTLSDVARLLSHPAFTIRNPNRLRSLVGAFAHGNTRCFHDASGDGYRLTADTILQLNEINPQTAARLLSAFESWRGLEPGRRELMHEQIERVLESKGLSRDVFEIAKRISDRP